ncbi:MAG: CoA transferase [Candidatus Obscuribacter sp.]|nr:CoA transferase [Candidatus Obscuribacter sp.]MBK9618041.1 CoA transferase [Candidatus Obscuribacter sp.]
MTLAKIKILDFTHLLPGEVASTLLSDMGAQILRIEKLQKGLNESLPPIVDGESLYFWALHRNKKRIRLDLKKESAKELIKKLVKDADVILENFRPGVMERLGLGYETLKSINPAIVYCSISGYGSHSKWSNRPGHDLTFVAEAGILDETLDRDGAPVLPGVFISDYMSGSYGALAVVAALYQVKETSAGQHLEISMFESALSTLSVLGTVDMRLGLEELHSRYPENLPNHRIYRCKDKRFLACAPFEPQFWQIFLHKIERTDLTKYDVIEDKVILIEEVSKTIAQKTFKEWMAIFNEPPDCCVSPVNTVDEALDFLPEGRNRVVTAIEHDKIGTIHQIKSPLYQLFAKRDSDVFYTDTDACLAEVLKTLDYSQSEIEKIKQEQASK